MSQALNVIMGHLVFDWSLQCFQKILCTKSVLMAHILFNASESHVFNQHSNYSVNGRRLQIEERMTFCTIYTVCYLISVVSEHA